MKSNVKPGYVVGVDDNFHYRDQDASWTRGRFDDVEAAVAASRQIVDRWLEEAYEPGMTADALLRSYKMFGEDPFVVAVGGAPPCKFSAWEYARERAAEIVRP